MKKNKINISILFMLLVFAGLVSCSESDDTSVTDNWPAENVAYIDSIAAEAHANVSGDWKIFLANGLDSNTTWPSDCYVYCKVKQTGTGTESPIYSDYVWVNYSGSMINGVVFDVTYTGEFNVEYMSPVELSLRDCVNGFATALQEMVAGDVWEIYIPANLGYGTEEKGVVKPSSTLIFTVNLVEFGHYSES